MNTLFKILSQFLRPWGVVILHDPKSDRIPESVKTLTIEIPLVSGTYTYSLNKYQRLNKGNDWLVLLRAIYIPMATTFSTADANSTGTALTKSPTGKDIAPVDVLMGGYLFLKNRKSELIRDTEPLIRYILDNNRMEGRHAFNELGADFTTSAINFQNTTVVDANAGKSILLVVEWQDVYWGNQEDKYSLVD